MRRAALRVIINDEEQRRRAIDAVMRCNLDEPMELVLQRWEPRRTVSANNLYWDWLGQMAQHFSRKAGPFGKDDIHDLMRHKFLGYQPARIIGRTEIPAKLRSTTDLSKGEMCHYMSQIDAWSADHGCLLQRGEDNEYDEWAKRQEK